MLCYRCLIRFKFLLSLLRNSVATYVFYWAVMLSFAFFLMLSASAQTPPDGLVPRRVTHLMRVPEPLGGLVAYRKGKLWGYSDTSGHVLIKPVFQREPAPFALGVGLLTPEQDSLTLINARGEFIRASHRQAIGFAPGEQLQLVSRKGIGFRPALAGLHYPKGRLEAVWDTLWLSPSNNADDVRLSLTRGLRYRQSRLPGKLAELDTEHGQGALIDEHGKPLTKYIYSSIDPFVRGFAVAKRTGPGAGWVLLNRRGQEVVVAPRGWLTPLYQNRTIVTRPAYDAASGEERNHAELVDSTGRVLQTYPAYVFANWLGLGDRVVMVIGKNDGPNRLCDLNGRDLLPGQVFSQIAYPWNNRIWVRTMDGKEGLLNRQLQWITPPQFDKLYYGTEREMIREVYQLPATIRYDTAYAVVKQHGQYGLLSYRTGQVVVPIRYDAVARPLSHGLASLVRQGKEYVVDAQGRELMEGTMPYDPDCREGTCRATVVRGNQATVITTTGQLVCPWVVVRGEGGNLTIRCHLPLYGHHGLVIVQDCFRGTRQEAENLIDRDGKPQLPWQYERVIAHPGFYTMQLLSDLSAPQRVLYDERLRPLTLVPASEWRWLPGQWMTNGFEMYHSSGKHITVPVPSVQRFVFGDVLLPDAPFAKGVWRLTRPQRGQPNNEVAGYLTLGGRQLWEE